MDKNGITYVMCNGKNETYLKDPSVPDSLQNFEAVIHNMQNELKDSDFIVSFKKDLFDVLNGSLLANNVQEDIDIVCYGLGCFSTGDASRYQLGFLLLLKDILHSTNIYIYDPKFSVEEVSFLKGLGMSVLSVNEEAKRQLKKKSICFMPHCPFTLYNNLLWANWSIKNLSELVIIGNSFENYWDLGYEEAKYLHLAVKFVTEIGITNNFRHGGIFSGFSIHFFKLNSLNAVDPLVWTVLDEPQYRDDVRISVIKR